MSIQRALIPSSIDFLSLPDASIQDRSLLIAPLRFGYLHQLIDFIVEYRLAEFVNRILDLLLDFAFLHVPDIRSKCCRPAENDQ